VGLAALGTRRPSREIGQACGSERWRTGCNRLPALACGNQGSRAGRLSP
jgi:hypothetical protein